MYQDYMLINTIVSADKYNSKTRITNKNDFNDKDKKYQLITIS